MMNDFSQLSAESPESRLAQVASHEPIVDHGPDGDPYHDAAAYRDEGDEPHRGWPGDGSGEDDLADLMATGDEGCCDGPECDDPCDDAEDAYLDASFEDRTECDFMGE